ncbi:MAG TPA: flagellar basal body protein FliL [Alphaproteobacteria bacterium]|nr:flagellar basal body protein FliL [Alphaproteobacteria bacterium]
MADELDENTESEQSIAVPHKKKILILLLPIFLVVGSVVGVYFSGLADSLIGGAGSDEKKMEREESVEAAAKGVFYEVPEILVNLSVKAGQKPVYFKIKVVLEMESAADVAYAEKMQPRITDSLQFYLREMRLEEVQGSMGTYRLKEEILNRLTKILAPAKVNDVLFKEILIQ